MKKITIVTAIAAILAVAPLMVGCGDETTDEVNFNDDDSEDDDLETGASDLEPSSGEESEDGE